MMWAVCWLWEQLVFRLWGASIAVEERLSAAHYRAEARLRREEHR